MGYFDDAEPTWTTSQSLRRAERCAWSVQWVGVGGAFWCVEEVEGLRSRASAARRRNDGWVGLGGGVVVVAAERCGFGLERTGVVEELVGGVGPAVVVAAGSAVGLEDEGPAAAFALVVCAACLEAETGAR